MNYLYPYQREGVEFLTAKKRAYLADEMGLGKTAQAIRAASKLGADHILVICPASAIFVWRREWKKWADESTPIPAVISYSSLVRRIDDVMGADWDLVIMDEAHYIKTPSAKRSKAALKVARSAEHVWLLSGTPMPNDPSELWNPVKHLWPEFPASLGIHDGWQWYQHFCKYTETQFGPRAYAVNNAHVLKPFLKEAMLRRTWQEAGLDLPPLRICVDYLDRDDGFATILEEMGASEFGAAYVDEHLSEDPHVARLRRLLGEYKATPIGERIIGELQDQQYKQIVVLAHHLDVIERLQQMFSAADIGVVGFTGDTPATQRGIAVTAFENGKAAVFLGQSQAAGIAINLQSAHEMVLVEPSWSPGDNAQAIKRIHRIGQASPCRARIFCVPDTLDESIMGVIAQKTAMQLELEL